jgi:hypothetical protein
MCQEVFSRCSIMHIDEWRRSFRRLYNMANNIPRASTYIERFIFSGNPLCWCFYLIFGIITMSIPAKYLNRNIYLNILIKFDLVDIRWELLQYIISLVEINYDMTYNMAVWQYHCLIYVFLWHHLPKL